MCYFLIVYAGEIDKMTIIYFKRCFCALNNIM